MKTILIHRNRNSREVALGKSVTDIDYSFDYRGKSKLLLLLKAMICATEIPHADVYLVEGSCLLVAKIKRLFNRKARIILMVHSAMFRKRGRFKTFLLRRFLKGIDGVIAVSKMVREHSRRYVDCPVRVAYHFIDVGEFRKLKPGKRPNILFVCERIKETGYIKGFDIALRIFEEVRKKVPKARMYVLGSGSDELDLPKGVYGLGYRPIGECLESCKVIFSPSRYDAFNLAVLEAFCAGLECVVSENTGAKEVVGSYGESEYVNAIVRAFWKAKPEGRECHFIRERCICGFQRAFEGLIK